MTLAIDISALDYGVKMTTIHITKNIEDAFTSHGEKEYPHECCGFIIGNFKGNDSFGLEYLPASNGYDFIAGKSFNEKSSGFKTFS